MSIWNLLAAHAFNYIVLRVNPGLASCEDLATALILLLCVICGVENDTKLGYLAILSFDRAFVHLWWLSSNLFSPLLSTCSIHRCDSTLPRHTFFTPKVFFSILQYIYIYLLYKAEKPSVRLSVRLHFWNAHNSVVSASIETGLARNESCIIEED